MEFGTIRRCEPFVKIILGGFGVGVLEAFQGFADGVGHGAFDLFFWVVPIDSQSAVFSARPVDGDGVCFWSASMRWVASSAAKNLMPKLSTGRVKFLGRVECLQRPEVFSTGA